MTSSFHSILISLLIVSLLLVHLFFVLAAVSIKRASSSKLRELARKGCPAARHARVVLIKSSKYLLSAQVGVFLSTLLFGFALTQLVAISADWLVSHYAPSYQFIGEAAMAVLLFLFSSLIALLSIQITKGIARAFSEKTLCLVAIPLLAISRLLAPFVAVSSACSSLLLKPFGLKRPSGRDSGVSPEEISQILELSSESGQIEEDEREMIQRVFSFSETLVKEVMTPRSDIVSVAENASLDQILQTFALERLSRVVVIGNNLDEVRGTLHAKDLIQFIGRESQPFDIHKILRKPYFVPGSRTTGDLLPELRQQGIHLTIVLDEHGGVDGLLTIEDLLEEIVGEILDEYDSPSEELEVRRTKSGDLMLDASILIDDLNTQYRLDLPTGEYDTLAGFVTHKLGRIPEIGEIFGENGLNFRIEAVEQNRVTQVRLLRARSGHDQSAGSAPTIDKKGSSINGSSQPNPLDLQGSRVRISNLR